MQTSHSALQNESLHLLVLTMDIKAGITLQESSSYIKAQHCLQRKRNEGIGGNLCSPGFLLQAFFLWGGKLTNSHYLIKWKWKGVLQKRGGSATAITSREIKKGTNKRWGVFAIRADNARREVDLLHILFWARSEKRYLLIKSSVARAQRLIWPVGWRTHNNTHTFFFRAGLWCLNHDSHRDSPSPMMLQGMNILLCTLMSWAGVQVWIRFI